MLPPKDQGSVTHCVDRLVSGQASSAEYQFLWDRYFPKPRRLAAGVKGQAYGAPVGGGDEEDAVLDAFQSFFRRAALGGFLRLDSREDLWRILSNIAKRKIFDMIERECRLKRGGGRVVRKSDLESGPRDDPSPGLDAIAGSGPDPASVAEMKDEAERLLFRLDDETLEQIVVLRAMGLTVREIAELFGCSPRTVAHRLELIRRIWEEDKTSV